MNSGLDLSTFYRTNAPTSLEYSFTRSDNGGKSYVVDEAGNRVFDETTNEVLTGMEKWTKNQVLYFAVPAVKSLSGNLQFQKQAYGENLAGATFRLTTTDDATFARTATSGANGVVAFAGIPSGHNYVVTEISAPDGYVVSQETKNVSISWGKTIYDGKTITDGNNAFVYSNVLNETYTTFPVTKTWVDGGATGRPSIEITLTQYKDNVATGKSWGKTLTAADALEGNPNQWSYTFGRSQTEKLPLKDTTDDKAFTYKATEATLADYTAVVSDDGQVIVNYANQTITVSGEKHWVDDEQDATKRPTVVVELKANGQSLTPAQTVTLANGKTSFSFTGLPRFDAKGEIQYSVVENTDLTNYSAPEYSGSYDITNRINQQTAPITVTKVWVDNGNEYDTRPATIPPSLLADGKPADENPMVVDVDTTTNTKD